MDANNQWTIGRALLVTACLWVGTSWAGEARDEPFTEGPETCKNCHSAEYEVWEKSQHHLSFREIHRHPKAREFLAATSGERSMKRDETCGTCHFTQVVTSPGRPPRPAAGPSCESCHGPSSQWRSIHNDYGGQGVTAENESAEHRQQRHQAAREAGMIWSFMHYDIAANCMECHGLANDELEASTLAQLYEAGHPINGEFELVKYSQGSVRHRFYPPDVTTNAEMSEEQLARLWVVGQAAQLVSATDAAESSEDAAYSKAQEARATAARQSLEPLAAKNEAIAGFLASPSGEAGRELAEALKEQDLTELVGDRLPDPKEYR